MANQHQKPGDVQQGDNRQAGDVDGNCGAKPQTGSQGVNQSAGNQAGGDNQGEGAGAGTSHQTGGTEHKSQKH